MINFKKYIFICFSIIFFSINCIAIEIDNIVVSGSEYLDKEAIFTLIDDKDELTNEQIVNLISKNLYNTGNFKSVEIDFENNYIYISVVTNPIINKIKFIDNKRFKKDELLEIFNEINNFKNFNQINIDNFINEINDMYKSYGYNQIFIDYTTNEINGSDEIDLNFFFEEGSISKINKVFFEGNAIFSYRTLENVIESKPKRDLLFFISNNFKEYKIQQDINSIKNFYANNGYIKTTVDFKTEYLKSKNKFNIYFYINEGEQYNFGKLNIKFEGAHFSSDIQEKSNKILERYISKNIKKNNFNKSDIEKIEILLTDFIFESEIEFFELSILQEQLDNNINIEFNIKKILPTYVKFINIFGNSRTKDNVIRREIIFSEGDAINDQLIAESKKNLARLNIFKEIKFDKEYINDELVDINIFIKEKTTGDFNIGLSLGSLNGASFITNFNQNNIGGTGRALSLAASTASKNKNLSLNVTEPRFFNYNSRFNYGFNYKDADYSNSSSYKLNSFESNLGFHYYLNDNLRQNISLSYEINDYTITNSKTASANINSLSGKNNIIRLKNILSYNTIHSFIRPTDGNNFKLFNTLSPITNNKDGFFKNTFIYKKYIPIDSLIFSTQFKIGNIVSLQNENISDSEKFSLGGNWLRGFDQYGVGPRNSYTSYVGGNNVIVSKFDIQKPLFPDSQNPIDLFVFSDIGTVFDNKNQPSNSKESIRSSIGYGIKMYSPIGPIGLSWGFPITEETYDIKRSFLFSIGNLN